MTEEQRREQRLPDGPITAQELKAILDRDEFYQAEVRHQRAEIAAVAAEERKAEAPIVADLRGLGLDVDSVWDLAHLEPSDPAALNQMLIHHLDRGGYPDRVVEGLARALVVGPPPYDWDFFSTRFLHAQWPGESTGVAVVLSEAATADRLDDLLSLLRLTDSEDRIFFLRPIRRLGGDLGISVLARLQDDLILGAEARAQLRHAKQLERRRESRAQRRREAKR